MKVKLSGKAAWQFGSTGLGRTEWETRDCSCGLCQTGRFVAVDEPAVYQDDDCSPWRHIAKAALYCDPEAKVGVPGNEFPPVEAYARPSKRNR